MHTDPGANAPSPAAVLRAALAEQGAGLIDDAARLHTLLLQRCPQQMQEIGLLMAGLGHQIPQALRQVAGTVQPADTFRQMAEHLQEAARLTPGDAQWVVDAWAYGFGVASAATAPPLQPWLPATASPLAAPLAQVSPVAPAPATAPRKTNGLLLAGISAIAVLGLVGAAYAFLTSSMAITDVVTSTPVAGNGKPHEVTLRYTARNAEIKGIDVRVVRSDAPFQPMQWTVPVDATTQSTGAFAAGTLSTRAQTPQRTTLSYTLVTRDGKRSAAFEKTFDIVPPAAITQAVAPTRITVGQPYGVTLNYRRGGSDIVKVVRRVVDSDVAWPETETSLPVQLSQAQGQHEVRLDAPTRPMRSTLEFTLVDAAGISSEPVRVNVAAGAAGPVATFGTVISVTQVGGASGVGAVGGAAVGAAVANQFGRGTGRAALTVLGAVGGAMAGHQVEQNMRGSSMWETTVQVDGGGVTRIRHPYPPRWQAGSRVRVTGNAIQG